MTRPADAAGSRKTFEVLRFTYRQGSSEHPLRLVIVDCEPWFVARDICAIVKCPMIVVFNGDEDDHILIDRRYLGQLGAALGGTSPEVSLVSEGRFYEIVLGHGNDKPREFKRWVTREVLPTVRHIETASTQRRDLPFVRKKITIADTPRPLKRPARPGWQKQTALYRFYDAAGALLYVGVTWSVTVRMKQHRTDQPWWKQISDVRVEQHPTRRAAEAAETTAIRTENPKYNIKQAS